MHTIHHTKAVILRSQPTRETDKMYWLFTEDFGLVVAVATGVRKAGSKLAGQLVDYSFVEADLVKGRDVWRLISATSICAPLAGQTQHPLARAYVRILGAVDRFVIDEGAHGDIFATLCEAGDMVGGAYTDAKRFDTLVIWRILVSLGYIGVDLLDQQLYATPLLGALASLDDAQTKAMIERVNMTIKETHL
jgi:hypothetical protein